MRFLISWWFHLFTHIISCVSVSRNSFKSTLDQISPCVARQSHLDGVLPDGARHRPQEKTQIRNRPADQISENCFGSLKNEDDILSYLAQNLTFFSPHIWTSQTEADFSRGLEMRENLVTSAAERLLLMICCLLDAQPFVCAHISCHSLISFFEEEPSVSSQI